MSRFPYFKIFLTTLFINSTGAALGQAQEGQNDFARSRYTLPDLVSLALRDNFFLISQSARIEENLQAGAQARTWLGPSVDLATGRRKTTSASGPLYEAALSLPLPFLGKTGLRGSLLNLQAESWRIQRAATETDIALNVIRLSYEYTVNQRKAEFAEKRLKRFELINEYLSGRVFPTPQGKAERNIVRNRLKGLVSDLIHSQAEFKVSFAKLKVYVPLNSGTYPDVAVPWLAGAKSLNEEEWLAKALENNPGLRLQRLVTKSAEMEKSLARKDGLPDPALTASYDQAKAGETEKNYSLGVSLALPSWNSNRAGVRSAEQRRLAEERLLSFEEQKLKAELPSALVEYEAARQVVLKYPSAALSDLEDQIKEAEQGFRKSQVDLLTFLELDGSVSETFNRALDAQVELADRLVELFTSTQERDAATQLGSY